MLKLNKNGVPKEYIALLTLSIVPLICLVSLCIGKLGQNKQSHKYIRNMLKMYPCKLAILLIITVWASFSVLLRRNQLTTIQTATRLYSYYFYIVCFALYLLLSLFNLFNAHFIRKFFANIVDPTISLSNYYAIFYSLNNVGKIVTQTVLLKLIGLLNMQYCSLDFFKHFKSEKILNTTEKEVMHKNVWYLCILTMVRWMRLSQVLWQ